MEQIHFTKGKKSLPIESILFYSNVFPADNSHRSISFRAVGYPGFHRVFAQTP